jgi:hypothetical protein
MKGKSNEAKGSLRRTGKPTETMLVLTVGCLAVYLVFHVKAMLWVSLGVGLTGILSPLLSRWIDRGWMWLARGLGLVSNAVLLSVVYLFVVLPVALVRRMGKRDKLTRFDSEATSNFAVRDHEFKKEDLEKPW